MRKIKMILISLFILLFYTFICLYFLSPMLYKKLNKVEAKEIEEVLSEYKTSDTSRMYEDKDILLVELADKENLVLENESDDLSKYIDGYYKSEKNIKIPILIYHSFEDVIPKNDKWNVCITTSRFEENINTLLEAGYTFITFEDLSNYEKGIGRLPEKNVMITIDDGYKNNYTNAFPILQKYNVKANIFLITNYRGNEYLTWDEIRQMYGSGLVKFYSHGKDHIDYSKVSTETLKRDILESHNSIEKELGEEVLKVFAYPSGKHSNQSKNALKSAGIEIQVLTKYGTVNTSRKLDLTDLGRIRVQDNTTGKKIINIIQNSSY